MTDGEVVNRQRKLDRLLADGVISYALLWTLFNVGDLVGSSNSCLARLMKLTRQTLSETTDEDHQELIAIKIESTSIQKDPDGTSHFNIMGTRLLWNGKKYLTVHTLAHIAQVRSLPLPLSFSY